MADVTGANTTSAPIISANTAAILRHRAQFYSGTDKIDLPLIKGTRYIIFAVVSSGTSVEIGFGQASGTITDSRFTFSQAAGPTDLSFFFNSTPFTQYKEPSASFVYLSIVGTGTLVAAVAAFTG